MFVLHQGRAKGTCQRFQHMHFSPREDCHKLAPVLKESFPFFFCWKASSVWEDGP